MRFLCPLTPELSRHREAVVGLNELLGPSRPPRELSLTKIMRRRASLCLLKCVIDRSFRAEQGVLLGIIELSAG